MEVVTYDLDQVDPGTDADVASTEDVQAPDVAVAQDVLADSGPVAVNPEAPTKSNGCSAAKTGNPHWLPLLVLAGLIVLRLARSRLKW